MYVNRDTVEITVDSNGDGTDYTGIVNGRILSIEYVRDPDSPANDYLEPTSPTLGFDFTITTEDTTQNLWVETGITGAKTIAPRQATHNTAGVASLYSTDNSEPVEDYVFVFDERVKIIVANAGSLTTGSFTILWG